MEKENGEWDEEQKRDEAFAIESLSLIMTVMLYSCHFNAVPHWATNHPLSVYLSREKEINKHCSGGNEITAVDGLISIYLQ